MSYMQTYVRACRRSPAVLSARALVEGHWLVGLPCPACSQPFLAGAPVALVALGPGDDEKDQEKWEGGGYVSAPAVPVHAACAGLRVHLAGPATEAAPAGEEGSP